MGCGSWQSPKHPDGQAARDGLRLPLSLGRGTGTGTRTEAKNRTTCLLLALPARDPSGQPIERLVLLGITDTVFKGQSALEIPATEKRRAGLTVRRPAFVIVSEGNEDVVPGSWSYAPGDATFGQFSAKFLEEILIAFKAVVTSRKLQLVSRKG